VCKLTSVVFGRGPFSGFAKLRIGRSAGTGLDAGATCNREGSQFGLYDGH